MDVNEKYFDLLLSEKQLADRMVGGYADLSLKVFGMFGVGGVLLSWLFSKDADGSWAQSIGIACIALAVASCGIVVQGVATYCLTLGYIQYRNKYLNAEFKTLLARHELPIQAVNEWARGAARGPTTLAHVFLGLLHAACCIALLLVAQEHLPTNSPSLVALVAAWLVLLATAVIQSSLFRAMKRVFPALPKATARTSEVAKALP